MYFNRNTCFYLVSFLVGVICFHVSSVLAPVDFALAASETSIVNYNIVTTYTYSGNVQTFTAPQSGTYYFEAWGADGGMAMNANAKGGIGGYAACSTRLEQGDVVYIAVGGAGSDCTATHSVLSGGWNGGGSAQNPLSSEWFGSGGGATHFASVSGTLSSLSAASNHVIAVAGGGGGAAWESDSKCNAGGNGGGQNGANGGSFTNSDGQLKAGGQGGTQSAGGAAGSSGYAGQFGLGGIGNLDGLEKWSGGGGGWYGGGNTGSWGASSGGGSGRIGGKTSSFDADGITVPAATWDCGSNERSISGLTCQYGNSHFAVKPVSSHHGAARISYVPVYTEHQHTYVGGFRGEGNDANGTRFFVWERDWYPVAYGATTPNIHINAFSSCPRGFRPSSGDLDVVYGTLDMSQPLVSIRMPYNYTMPNGPVWFEREWVPITYAVELEPNGGTIPVEQEFTYDVIYGVRLLTPFKTGYTFAKWYEVEDSSKAPVDGYNLSPIPSLNCLSSTADDAKSTVDAYLASVFDSRETGDKMLAAQWEPISYEVSFSANSNDLVDGIPSAISAKYDEDAVIPSAWPTRNGYHFVSWNTQEDGSGETFLPGATVKNLSSVQNDVVHLYAQWEYFAPPTGLEFPDALSAFTACISFMGIFLLLLALRFLHLRHSQGTGLENSQSGIRASAGIRK